MGMKNIGIQESVSLDNTINLLNELLKIDSEAINQLISTRVLCNDELADHRTVQVGYDEENGYYKVGLLGILNGIFGVDSCGYGAICVEMMDGKIIKFRKLNV